MKYINIAVEDEEHKRLKQQALDEDVSLSELIRCLISKQDD